MYNGRISFQSLLLLALVAFALEATPAMANSLLLRENWAIQSSVRVPEQGNAVSKNDFNTSGWYKTDVPSTVLAALVKNKVYRDPYFGMNLRQIPGTTYPLGADFSNLHMPDGSPFKVPDQL
jgi:exo-1,4-beta-D-glucosaminidase